MELVDNAVDSRLPEQSIKVDLALHGGSVTVTSEGGEGMGPKDLERRYLPQCVRALLELIAARFNHDPG